MKLGKALIIPILVALCFGCAKPTKEIVYVDRPVEVQVPVTVYPYIEEIQCPKLPISKITKDTPNAQVVEYYVRSVKIQKACLDLYKKTIQEINKKAKPQ